MAYLRVDEQANYTDVICDGWTIRIYSGSIQTSDILKIYTSGTERWGCEPIWRNSSTSYYLGYDENKVLTIEENTPNRVIIRVQGRPDSSSVGTSYLTNAYYEYIYTIYADRFMVEANWFASGGAVTLDDNNTNGLLAFIDTTLTNPDNYYENVGSESDCASNTNYNSADYLLGISDEVNLQVINLHNTLGSGSTGTFNQRSGGDGSATFRFHWTNGSLADGVFNIAAFMCIIDSASREGSAKIYNSTDRLAMGDQYKDAILDQSPSKGDDVTDMVFPARISSGTLHADGAHHYDLDANDELKITLDTTRLRPSIVIHDWPFQYGTVASPTSILLNHLKMDDNAANNTLLAEVGPDAGWYDTTPTARNTSNDSVQADNFRGRALDGKGLYHVQMAVGSGTVHDNAFLKKGSLLIKITPQLAYDYATDSFVFIIRYDDNNRVFMYYETSTDTFDFYVNWGGSSASIKTPAFTENYSLQRQMFLLFSWDSDKDFCLFAIDGQIIGTATNTGSPTAGQPSAFMVLDRQDYLRTTDAIIDEVKTFSECLLPYGAYFIGNGAGLLADIDNPHADLTWFFDGQAAAAKGGANLASDKNPTNSGGSFVTTDPLIGANHWDANGASNVLTVAEVAEDIIDYNNGFVAGWFNVQSAAGGEYLIDCRADANNRISAVLDASNNIDVTYLSQGVSETITGDIAITDAKWFFLLITWDDNGGDKKVHSYIFDRENGTPQTIANTWGGGTGHTWYFTEDYNGANGVDAFIQTLWMGKKASRCICR
jgi:hypothetical protein